MMTLALASGDIQLVKISDAVALKQRIQNRLSLYLGEWFADVTAGVDWFSVSKNTDTAFIQNLISKELRKEENITAINSIDVVIVNDEKTSRDLSLPIRSVRVTYSVDTVYGTVSGQA